MESRIINATSEVPPVESDRYFMSTSRALSPVSARAVSLSSCAGCEVRYSTLTTVSPGLAVSHLMTGSVTLEWKLLMKKTLGHITPLKFSSSWIMQMSLTRRVSSKLLQSSSENYYCAKFAISTLQELTVWYTLMAGR